MRCLGAHPSAALSGPVLRRAAVAQLSAASQLARVARAPLPLPEQTLVRTMLPIATIIGACAVLMVPCAIRSLMPKSKKIWRRAFTGFSLAVVVSAWIFSGTPLFLATFVMMAVLAQNEYYRMATSTTSGNACYPTRKLGLLGSVAMYVAAASDNAVLRESMFPLTGTVTILYLLLRQERNTPPTTTTDVATSFMGIYYFGLMPSYWIRLRTIGPSISAAAAAALFLPPERVATWSLLRALDGVDNFTRGALMQWWTMFAIVMADVTAYFTGKRLGKTPLIKISPNKTWEGLLGGCAASVACSVSGAWLMAWPAPLISGALYGLVLATMALIGDLVVSLLKRSAGMKDTGGLLPGHGGLLDRIDSYLLVSAPAYLYVKFALPLFARLLPG